ncbi:endothelial zinc finger protein induced by tumor necrosis factor alpha-like isoform X2 [Salarias fasciatus]|uniref:endothelial zinc finger protein induced by tumor necrosis factor alpha-like isoform X2 n=1 Tax=Salarias fasciatus TaxID=181472 RepID=UPI0011765451|nr:endothelial zinc finger protein induced by tumor necrosis factor alpha-like isoform X2 [Salarias fasciatus]
MECFRDGVSSALRQLARAVLAAVRTGSPKSSLQELSPEAEEVCAVVDSLVLDAVEKILKMLGEWLVPLRATPTAAEPDPAEPDPPCLRPAAAEPDPPGLRPTAAEPVPPGARPTAEGVGEEARLRSEHILVLLHQAAAVDPGCWLLELRRDAADDEDRRRSPPATEEAVPASPAPPPLVDDHEYARPPGGHAAPKGGVARITAPAAPPVRCSQCSMLFPDAERLADHRRRRHPSCSACGAVFPAVPQLRRHQASQHGLLPFACDFCPKTFDHRTHRDLHVKARHTGEKTSRCDICGKGYACGGALRAHRATHFLKAFVCDVCGKAFHHACHLTRHQLLHRGERPHRCAACGKTFRQAAHLRSHQDTHSRDKQLCSVCGKSVRRLDSHILHRHSTDRPLNGRPTGTDRPLNGRPTGTD